MSAAVDGFHEIDELLSVGQRPVDLVVVSGAKIDHDVLVAEKIHHRARIVELVPWRRKQEEKHNTLFPCGLFKKGGARLFSGWWLFRTRDVLSTERSAAAHGVEVGDLLRVRAARLSLSLSLSLSLYLEREHRSRAL